VEEELEEVLSEIAKRKNASDSVNADRKSSKSMEVKEVSML
jgi:hypothetical protein